MQNDLYSKDPAVTVNRVIRILDKKAANDPELKRCSEALRRSENDMDCTGDEIAQAAKLILKKACPEDE
ncbi:hypothetical protein GZ77_20425 [Endozoicomonas montiporae]|uniref:Uncharacterized protein n=2 Tax=Endozoicomonas montiporae TaxID=1027273 RepID=A0A081N2Z7_9GAMM|nr:hypothetical protein [Endozoicomonas montiporae]AMO58091.1 hypothetical protein EZMO1_4167 [Endozoicomonas montiporae CL-33]KEQ12820.1 hypothetical protein GZ77_20425 [Endozoicomonas montiporae]